MGPIQQPTYPSKSYTVAIIKCSIAYRTINNSAHSSSLKFKQQTSFPRINFNKYPPFSWTKKRRFWHHFSPIRKISHIVCSMEWTVSVFSYVLIETGLHRWQNKSHYPQVFDKIRSQFMASKLIFENNPRRESSKLRQHHITQISLVHAANCGLTARGAPHSNSRRTSHTHTVQTDLCGSIWPAGPKTTKQNWLRSIWRLRTATRKC